MILIKVVYGTFCRNDKNKCRLISPEWFGLELIWVNDLNESLNKNLNDCLINFSCK